MFINNVEVKKGDCICGCCDEPMGFHYILGFAFQVDETNENTLSCMFHEISSDDHDVGYYPEKKTFKSCDATMCGYNIFLVNKDIFEQVVEFFKTENFEEADMFEYFDNIYKHAIQYINKY